MLSKINAGFLSLCLMLLPFSVFAQATPVADQVAEIKTEITTYIGYGVGLMLAMILGLWALRATGLLKPRG